MCPRLAHGSSILRGDRPRLHGGGVKGGRIIGKTDEQGGYCVETGWKHKEQPSQDNVVATIYSALGIDWKKTIERTRIVRPVRTAAVIALALPPMPSCR